MEPDGPWLRIVAAAGCRPGITDRRELPMIRRRYLLILLLCAAGLVAGSLILALRPSPPARYKLTVLPSLGGFRATPHSINDRGQVVGIAEAPAGASYIFLWDREQGFRNLGRSDDPPHPGRLSINNAGQIAGTVADPNGNLRAFLWDLSSGKRLLGTLGGLRSMAVSLNNKGQIAGYAEIPVRHRHAFLWDPAAGMRDLGTLGGPQSFAVALNDAGQVVGFAETTDLRTRAVLWDPVEGAIDLGEAGVGPYECDINNRGLIIRRVGTLTGKTYFHTWTRAGQRELSFIAGDTGVPCGLNDANEFLVQAKPTMTKMFGRVLRRRFESYLCDPNGRSLRLQDQVPVEDIRHFAVIDMNNEGWIIGMLRMGDSNHIDAVVLEPVGD
jgi:probable HAF family extracellular repeat protein